MQKSYIISRLLLLLFIVAAISIPSTTCLGRGGRSSSSSSHSSSSYSRSTSSSTTHARATSSKSLAKQQAKAAKKAARKAKLKHFWNRWHTKSHSIHNRHAKYSSAKQSMVYANAQTMLYHLKGCKYLRKPAVKMTPAGARAQGYHPCGKCRPPQ